MKVRLFNKGKGWYESVSNYKNNEDKAYINYHFTKGSEPPFQDNGRGYSLIDIDLLEWKHSCYQGKVGMTVFKYQLATTEPTDSNRTQDNGQRVQTTLNDGHSDMFGKNTNDIVQTQDLPFY